MSKNVKASLAALAFLGLLASSFAFAAEDINKKGGKADQSLQKTAGTPTFQILNINNYTSWVRSDNPGNLSPHGDNQGVYPRGTGANVIYTDGIVWGAKAFTNAAKTNPAPRQAVRVGGKAYGFGQRAGYVTGFGVSAIAASPSAADVRIYRVRRDYTVMSVDELKRDAAESNEISTSQVNQGQMDAIKDQYATDWTQWPASKGAPFIDRNKNGVYDPPPAFSATFTVDSLISQNQDEPGVAGSDLNSPADQVIWTVANDLDVSQAIGLFGSEPVGFEAQYTIWGYKRTDALGNLYFKRIRLINKGGVDTSHVTGTVSKGSFWLDSLFVCQWSDIDLGNAGDDIAGCDSTLSMGFVYNGFAVDNTYKKAGLAPAASGYDFLAGPTVTSVGDSAVVNFKRVYGKKNLPMSSFAYFSAGSPYSDPPNGLPGGYNNTSGEWWKLLRGFAPIGGFDVATQPFASGTFAANKFPLSGDPATGTGFLDGQGFQGSFPPGDRRILLNTGPFSMAPGDTQEIVVGTVAGLGADRISSVSIMKANDAAVQTTYNLLFQVSKAPASPSIVTTELDQQVIIEWGSNSNRVKDTETRISQPGSYTFEGYNVYQLPNASARLSEGKRIATYDVENTTAVILESEFDVNAGAFLLKPIQFGSNSGIKRYFVFDRDYIRDIDKIYNGQEYYLAVTAYSRVVDPGFAASLESSPVVVVVRSKVPFGTAQASSFGDTVSNVKAGPSDGKSVIQVVSPTQVTGHSYKVTFGPTAGTWNLIDVSGGAVPGSSTVRPANTTVLTGATNQAGDGASPIVDGLQVKVFGAPDGTKDFLHSRNPAGAITPPSYASFSTFNGWGFPAASGADALSGGGPSIGDYGGPAGERWGIHTGGSGGGDESYDGRFVPRVFRNDNFSRLVPYDFELRFTASGGKAYLAFTSGAVINVPFEIWNIGIGTPTDASDDYQMIPWINDADANGAFNVQQTDHGVSGGDNDPYTDWIYWYSPVNKTPGSTGYLTEFANIAATYDSDPNSGANTGAHKEVMARLVLVAVNGGSISNAGWPTNLVSQMPASGNTFRIISTKPNSSVDTYTFNTATYAAARSADLENASAKTVGVYPNPYYAFNPAETNRFNRYVTFNNLAPKATIRIFNLAGQLVRTINKDNTDQFQRWDLLNQSNLPVASGMYLAHVEMPDVGVTKVLKLAIIQEQEILDTY